jgi:PIN domain nuclease of toxin-antitoxin system
MPGLVLDTHAAVWYLQRDSRLSKAAEDAIDRAIQAGDPAYVASISVVELTYLVEKGRVPAAALEILRESLTDPSSGFSVLPLDLAVADALAKIPRKDVPALPDRVIAATAAALQLPLVTKDGRIRATNLETIW